MSRGETHYRFLIALADTDRGLYEDLDVRLVRHPSETEAWLLTRALAYALAWEPGLTAGSALCVGDEPAFWAHDDTGRANVWIELGAPSHERLDRATRQAPRVLVFTAKPLDQVQRALGSARLHHPDRIEVVALPAPLVDALEPLLEGRNRWTLTVTEGRLFLEVAGRTLEGEPIRWSPAQA